MAFAKLVGKNVDNEDVHFDVIALPCKLGRQSLEGESSSSSSSSSPSTSSPSSSSSSSSQTIVLHSSDPQLSRTHAEILWNDSVNKLCIRVCSKNGVTVDKVKYKLDDVIEINQKSAIKIGGTKLYILLPLS